MANTSGDIVSWSVNAQIPGGPGRAVSGKLSVDSYFVYDNIIVPKGTPTTVNLPPSTGASLILINAADNNLAQYLAYQLEGTGDWISLNGPLMLIGNSAELAKWTSKIVFKYDPPAPTTGSKTTLIPDTGAVSILMGKTSAKAP